VAATYLCTNLIAQKNINLSEVFLGKVTNEDIEEIELIFEQTLDLADFQVNILDPNAAYDEAAKNEIP
jgi:hypothetical protein